MSEIEENIKDFRIRLSDLNFLIDSYVKEFTKFALFITDEEILGSTYKSLGNIYDEIHNLRVDVDIIEDQM